MEGVAENTSGCNVKMILTQTVRAGLKRRRIGRLGRPLYLHCVYYCESTAWDVSWLMEIYPDKGARIHL